MRIFKTPPYRDIRELLDDAGQATEHEIKHTLRDIRRANIFGLGTWVVKHHLTTMLGSHPAEGPVRVLDLATGSADIPQALLTWAEQEGRDLSFVATDISHEVIRVAVDRIRSAGFDDRVEFLTCDAANPPFADNAFHYVTCNLAFHHLTLDQARLAMSQMARIARHGFVINDIYRSQGAWYMAWVLVHFSTTNRLTRHDGPASVYRAFTPREIRRLGDEAGVDIRVYRHPFWRVAAVGTAKGAHLNGNGRV